MACNVRFSDEEGFMYSSMGVNRFVAVCLGFLLVTIGVTACSRERGVEAASESIGASVSQADVNFMTKATDANLAEINMARMALERSSDKDVKDFANMIQRDHNDALENLTDLMRDNNVPEPKNLAAEQRNVIHSMTSLSGPSFDREFANTMVADHEKAVEMFREEQANAQNPDLKKYVNDVLPKLEMHSEKSRELQSKLSGSHSR